jgi:thiol-disulfide isomerase/thioredoxin
MVGAMKLAAAWPNSAKTHSSGLVNDTKFTIGDQLPTLECEDSTGAPVELWQLVAGSKSFVVFASADCPPCHSLVDSFSRSESISREVRIIFLSFGGFLDSPIGYGHLRAPSALVSEYAVSTFPTILAVDPGGTIRQIVSGLVPVADLENLASRL